MSHFQKYCLPGLLLGALAAAGCAQSPTAPTNLAFASEATAAKPGSALPAGLYSMTFLNSAREPVTTLPVGAGSHLLVKVHVEESNHVPATEGALLFETCRW